MEDEPEVWIKMLGMVRLVGRYLLFVCFFLVVGVVGVSSGDCPVSKPVA